MIDQKQPETVEYFSWVAMITNNARCTQEIKFRIDMTKAAFNKTKTVFISKLDLKIRKKVVMCYIWVIVLYGAETWTFQEVDQIYLEGIAMLYFRRMEMISWTNHVRNEEVLQRVKEERNILQTMKRRKANWIGHILCRNCLRKHITEGKLEGSIEVMGR